MQCSNPLCHAELGPGDRFCGECGYPATVLDGPGMNGDENRSIKSSTSFEEMEQAARSLVRQERKIEAIKMVREKTGWGLKQAKDFVESL